LGACVAGAAVAALGWQMGEKAPRIAAAAAYLVSGTWAGAVAWKRALADERAPTWEPTPRAVS
jgi:hypothetical protein